MLGSKDEDGKTRGKGKEGVETKGIGPCSKQRTCVEKKWEKGKAKKKSGDKWVTE